MSRSTLIPSALVCLGLAVVAVAQTRDAAKPAAGPPAATTLKTLQKTRHGN